LQLKIGDNSIPKDSYIDANQDFTRCGNHLNILLSWEYWEDLSLLSSLLYDMKYTPHLAK
jgi:hypothetical protein